MNSKSQGVHKVNIFRQRVFADKKKVCESLSILYLFYSIVYSTCYMLCMKVPWQMALWCKCVMFFFYTKLYSSKRKKILL